VVLSIQYVFRITEDEDMRKIFKQQVEEHRKGSGFRPASAPLVATISASDDANPTHPEDFASLLIAAAKMQPQGGQTSVVDNCIPLALRPHVTLGWDIAITPEGPVAIEANETGDFFFLQEACGPLVDTRLAEVAMAYWNFPK
jgi:hypothetical protein